MIDILCQPTVQVLATLIIGIVGAIWYYEEIV